MFYAQPTAKGHIIAIEPNVFLPQVQILIHYLIHRWGMENLGADEVEWAGKAETR